MNRMPKTRHRLSLFAARFNLFNRRCLSLIVRSGGNSLENGAALACGSCVALSDTQQPGDNSALKRFWCPVVGESGHDRGRDEAVLHDRYHDRIDDPALRIGWLLPQCL